MDGVWVLGALCFGGSDDAGWVRNLRENPSLSAHVPSDEDAIIIEGEAEQVTDPAHPLAAASTPATREKYPQYFESGVMTDEFQPFWVLRPRRAYAWTLTGFPNRATRWTFD